MDPYLLDTNILLRLSQSDPSPHERAVVSAVEGLYRSGTKLFYTLQNAAEFWNVSTRPKENNGVGLSIEAVNNQLKRIENTCALLLDTYAVAREWRRLVVRYGVSGRQVHDARLVATMLAHDVPKLLTLNTDDFFRYGDVVEAVHPGRVAG